MASTIAPASALDLRARLEDLLGLAADYAVLEDRLERKSRELGELGRRADEAVVELGLRVVGPVDLKGSAFELCQRIQDAIDVLDLAAEPAGRVR